MTLVSVNFIGINFISALVLAPSTLYGRAEAPGRFMLRLVLSFDYEEVETIWEWVVGQALFLRTPLELTSDSAEPYIIVKS
jgi:hypothetical protein